jgi:hypothetical protein
MSAVSACSGNAQRLLNYIADRGAVGGSDARAATRADAAGAIVQLLQDRVELSAEALRMAARR